MSRRRYISTDISTDIKLAELAQYGTLPLLLYTWAIPHLDDWGRMSGEPRQFKLLVCPALDVSVSDVETALQQIATAELWCRYQVGGKWYIAIPEANWFKHQSYINAAKRRKDESKIPPQSTVLPKNTEERRGMPQNTASPSPSPSPSHTTTAATRAKEDKSHDSIKNHALDYAEKSWGRSLSPRDAEVITLAVNDLVTKGSAEAGELICKAADRCSDSNARTVKYLDSIVRRWLDQGILDLDALKRDDDNFEKRKNRASPKGGKQVGKHQDDSKPWETDPYIQQLKRRE